MTAVDPKRRPFLAAWLAATVSAIAAVSACVLFALGVSWQPVVFAVIVAVMYGAVARWCAESVRSGRRSVRALRRIDQFGPRNVRVLIPYGPEQEFSTEASARWATTGEGARDDCSRKAPQPLTAVPDERIPDSEFIGGFPFDDQVSA